MNIIMSGHLKTQIADVMNAVADERSSLSLALSYLDIGRDGCDRTIHERYVN